MLNSFYELTLIVSRIINVDIHLEFQMFDAFFNHFNVIEMIVLHKHLFFKLVN